MKRTIRSAAALAVLGLFLQGCGGDDDGDSTPLPEERRAQDERVYTVNEAGLRATLTTTVAAERGGNGAFLPIAGLDTDRWVGVLNNAAYQVEVPRNWNGILVMYAHGYRGTGANLTVAPPSIREYLIRNGYAWAASSYSKNYYDVRAGVEDTNALALAFRNIAAQNGRTLAEPSKTYITGHSMGGHVAGAAVDQEALETAVNKVRYSGAVPMCGVLGDTELFDFFAAYQAAAQHLAGFPATSWPVANWAQIEPQVKARYFTAFPSGATPGALTPDGVRLRELVENLSGGERPTFDVAFTLPASGGGYTDTVWGTFGRDGTVNGILNREGVDTRNFTYVLDDDPTGSQALNQNVFRVTADPEANRLRRDGLRWIPKTNARISVPVVTIHTLGDGYVPWSMQQIYRRRADANGTSNFLVQRAIRGVSHCDFTLQEQEEAFEAMTVWEQTGRRPLGDQILDPALTATPTYGCRFSRTPEARDSAGVRGLRPLAPACPAGSAAPNFG